MNHQRLDELYFEWLYSQVADAQIEDPSLTHWKMLQLFFATEYVWVVSNDDNRAEDGKALRREFLEQASNAIRHGVDREWIELGCSVLELMVGLSRRLAFEADGEPHYWFWTLVDNLGLEHFNDVGDIPSDEIKQALQRVIFRTYEPDGTGGFFPLRNPVRNQRKVELWYQLSAYVLELGE